MNRRLLRLLAITATVLLFPLTTAADAHAQTVLRFKFRRGEVQKYVFDLRGDVSGPQLGANTEIGLTALAEMRYEALAADPRGNATVKATFDRMRFEMSVAAGGANLKMGFDSRGNKDLGGGQFPDASFVRPIKALVGKDLTLKMDARGTMKGIDLLRETADALQDMYNPSTAGDEKRRWKDEEFKTKLMQGIHNFLIFPVEPVTKGKTWTYVQDTADGKTRYTFTYNGPGERDGKKVEVISVAATILESKPAPGQPPIKVGKQDIKGKVYFDNEAGRSQEIAMDINMAQIHQDVPRDQEINIRLKYTMKLQK